MYTGQFRAEANGYNPFSGAPYESWNRAANAPLPSDASSQLCGEAPSRVGQQWSVAQISSDAAPVPAAQTPGRQNGSSASLQRQPPIFYVPPRDLTPNGRNSRDPFQQDASPRISVSPRSLVDRPIVTETWPVFGSPESLPPDDSISIDNMQKQLMQSLQEVSDAAVRADRISKQAYDARASAVKQERQAKEKIRTFEELEERFETAETRMTQAQKSAAYYRSLYKQVLSAKESVEQRLQDAESARAAAESARAAAESRIYKLEMDQGTRAELVSQVTELQLRVQELEAMNGSLRLEQKNWIKERGYLTNRIEGLEQTAGFPTPCRDASFEQRSNFAHMRSPVGNPMAAVRRKGSFENGHHYNNGVRQKEGDNGHFTRLNGRSPFEPPYAPRESICEFPEDNEMVRHFCPEPQFAPLERMLEAGAPPHGKGGVEDHHHTETSKQKRLADGVDLLTQADSNRFEYEYSIINRKLSILDFTAELKKYDNVAWRSDSGPKVSILVKPGETKLLGTVVRKEARRAARFGLHFSWIPKPVPPSRSPTASHDSTGSLQTVAKQMRQNGILACSLCSATAIESRCKQAGIDQFVDVEFLPCDKSLFAKPDDAAHPTIVWRRPHDFLKGPISLFSTRSEVHPCDILQGALGDCWFLSSLAALTEYPDLVKAIFGKTEYNELGVYELLCYKNGEDPCTIIVDDYFPCNPQSGKPCYSHTPNNELWVLLLEKAWAKLHGSYEQIEGGIPYRAIMDLTGCTGCNIDPAKEDKDKLWAKLANFDRLGYLMCATTPGKDELTKSSKRPSAGIVPGHAYTLREAKELNGQRLVSLRNPWGQFEWDGDWCDSSPLWTEKMKKAFKPQLDGNDGTFWMDEKDFLDHFDGINVVYSCSRTGDSWITSRTQLTLQGEETCSDCIFFTVSLKTIGFFTLLQYDQRIVGMPDNVRLGFAVYGPLDCHEGCKQIAKSPCWATREIVEEISEEDPMEPGKYVMIVFNPTRVKKRQCAVLMHFDQIPANRRQSQISPKVAPLRTETRRTIELATAIHSADAQKSTLGPFQTSGNWMPDGGYVLAARVMEGGSASVDWDFSKSAGLQVAESSHGADTSKVTTQLDAVGTGGSDDFQFVAALTPTSAEGKRSMAFTISYSQK